MLREQNPTDGTGIKTANSIPASSSKNGTADQTLTYAMTALK
jgi:hypothetical protein